MLTCVLPPPSPYRAVHALAPVCAYHPSGSAPTVAAMDKPIRLQLDDQWHTRDLPVLATAARLGETDGLLDTAIASELDLTVADVRAAIRALTDGLYIEAVWGQGTFGDPEGDVFAVHLRERGRRTLGIWPTQDSVDGLIEALNQAADSTTDSEEKTLLRRASGQLGMVSRDILVDVVAAVVAKQSGVG